MGQMLSGIAVVIAVQTTPDRKQTIVIARPRTVRRKNAKALATITMTREHREGFAATGDHVGSMLSEQSEL